MTEVLDECKKCPVNAKCMTCPVMMKWVREQREKNGKVKEEKEK